MNSEYPFDVGYVNNFYENLNPWQINYVCAINRFPPQDLHREFTYCELGCGHGLSLNILAAANPQGHFCGVDLNPEHIANGRRVMTEGGLANVIFLEENFANLLEQDLPDFNFITLHGVFSWISAGMREKIVAFIARKLKPGGMVMVSYNTPQGWAVISPMRDFLQGLMAEGNGNLLEKARQGLEELRYLRDNGAGFFKQYPMAGERLNMFLECELPYIVHEFLVPHWQPLSFREVLSAMNRAGVEFAGSIPVHQNYQQLTIQPEFQDYLKKSPDAVSFQTRRDLINMTLFRSDVFCRAPRNPKINFLEKFKGTTFGTFQRKGELKTQVQLGNCPPFTLSGPFFPKLMNLIGGSAFPLEEILANPEFASISSEEIVSGLEWLVISEQVKVYARPSSPAGEARPFRFSRFNRALLLQEMPRRKSIPLASWTAGSGFHFARPYALALLAISEAGLEWAENWAGVWTVRNSIGDLGITKPLAAIIREVAGEMAYYQALGVDEPEGRES